MTTFLRLLSEEDKSGSLLSSCHKLRQGYSDNLVYEVLPEAFRCVPGAPFAYWVSDAVRNSFLKADIYFGKGRSAVNGLTTGDDYRFVRAHWEVKPSSRLIEGSLHTTDWRWVTYAKGGEDSPFYGRFPMVLNWGRFGQEMKAFSGTIVRSERYYLEPGLTWPLRARRFGPQCRPSLSIFSVRGYSANSERENLLRLLGLTNSTPFDYLFKVSLGRFGFPEFVVGTLKNIPVPSLTNCDSLEYLAHRAWSLRRKLCTIAETSHAFHLPAALRARLGECDPLSIEAELAEIQAKIDEIAFDLYGFSEADRAAALGSSGAIDEDASGGAENLDDSEDADSSAAIDQTDGLLSWAVGVAFGRFDWCLAIGEREAPPEPDPFAPLPAKSPGMLPDGAEPFHAHDGILVDDQGHPHDLPRLIEEVLARVDAEVPGDVRRWLKRDFFQLHLKQYSKSRRKAPIYWPLSTASGSYTMWLYYPSLTSEVLYTAVNDFIESPNGKLSQVRSDIGVLRDKASARSSDDDRALEALQTLELELIELRDLLLQIAPAYRPNHDDGVQITAAPLWELFRHKPWQKVLKDTWAKLEKGDYDWAHLAMAYWPDRVREKCKIDKSLAIAHDLEHLYTEPEPKAAKSRDRKEEAAE